MKCVAQIPTPLTTASSVTQITRERPEEALARWNRLMATALDSRQTAPPSATSRKSCSVVKQFRTWYIRTPNGPKQPVIRLTGVTRERIVRGIVNKGSRLAGAVYFL